MRYASPGYKRSKLVNSVLSPTSEHIIDFRGLNRKQVVEEGEMSDMKNLTSDNYPLLTPRKPRGQLDLPSSARQPIQIMRRYGKIALIAYDNTDNVSFYYDGRKISKVTGLSEKTRAVAINTKICFFPEKTYLTLSHEGDNVTIGDYGHLDSSVTLTAEVIVTDESVQMAMPEGHDIGYDDAINLNGTLTYTDSEEQEVTVSCVVSVAVLDAGEDYISLPAETFIELIGEGVSEAVFTGTADRPVPDLDYFIEWNNRLWGASSKENMIYACKLGDPKNWNYFQNTGLDSYYAQQGTDENFTGLAEYSGHLIFFKPNSMTRVYGTAPSNFQIAATKCYGVEPGSSLSVLTINDAVFYKSSIGIMAYQGGLPVCISDKVGSDFKNVVAGTEGQKYYASAVRKDGTYELLVFDIARGMWHKEDDTRFVSTCTIDNKLYYITTKPLSQLLLPSEDLYPAEDLYPLSEIEEGYAGIINTDEPSEEYKDLEWMAVFGPFDEYIEEHKIYSKLAFSLKALGLARANIYVSIDEGPWELVKKYEQVSTIGDYLPIIPRRCDRYSVKIVGAGNCAIKSITRRVRQGSFARI